MRIYLSIFLLVGIGTLLTAQKIHLPVQVKNQWGFLEVTNETSRLDTTTLYDQIGDLNIPWFGQASTQSGYFHIEQNGKLGLVNAFFQSIIKPDWQEIQPISNQYFLVANDGSYSIIDRNAKALLKADNYQAIKLPRDNPLSFFMLLQSGKWGVRKQGQRNWAIEPIYFDLEFLDVGAEGVFKIQKGKNEDNQWQIINWQNENLSGFEGAFEQIVAASKNHIAVQKTSRKTNWSIRDLKGKELLVLAPNTNVKSLNKHLFAYKEKGKNTYSVLVMRESISPLVEQFNDLKYLNEEVVLYSTGNKVGFIQSNGRLIEINSVGRPKVFSGKGATFRIKCGQKWGLFSIQEQDFIQDCVYDSISPFVDHIAYAWENNKMGIINSSGKEVVSPRFERISSLITETNTIYAYWEDSIQVIRLNQNGNLEDSPSNNSVSSTKLPDRFYRPDYNLRKIAPEIPTTLVSFEPNVQDTFMLWKEATRDTLWIEQNKSYWHFDGSTYQLMKEEEVEVVLREKSGSTAKKKKSKKAKNESPTPKKTQVVKKWLKQGASFKFLRKASPVDWMLAYQDIGGRVSNELTNQGRNKFSLRKISIFSNDGKQLQPDLEMVGIRLSDFEEGLSHAAFMDIDGKIGLMDKEGKQVLDTEGLPLRFTYISKATEGKMQVCHPTSAFSQVGKSLQDLFKEFNVEAVKGSGDHQSQLKSNKKGLWAYTNPDGKIAIPFEYELATPFKNDFAINKKNGKWGAINAKNETLIPFEFDAIMPENNNWKVIKTEGEQGSLYYDTKGQSFDQESQAKLSVKGLRLFVVQNNDNPPKYGYANSSGKLVIPHQFDEATDFHEGIATVKKGNQWSFINEKGKKAVTLDSDIIGITKVGQFSEGLCPIQKTTILNKQSKIKYGYLDIKGNLVITPQFDRAGMFSNGIAIVDSIDHSNGSPERYRALIDKQGKLLTKYEFKHIFPFDESGYAKVIYSKMDREGIINLKGQPVTKSRFIEVKNFKDGIAGRNDKDWNLFDYNGNAIELPGTVSGINHFSDGNLLVRGPSNLWSHLMVKDQIATVQQDSFSIITTF